MKMKYYVNTFYVIAQTPTLKRQQSRAAISGDKRDRLTNVHCRVT